MDTETIIYENYIFKFNIIKDQIKVNMIDNTLMDSYEGIIKEDDIYVKPIKKFYSMIVKSLNKDQFYTFSITQQKSNMVCNISYNTEMIDIEEHIILNKVTSESKELLLISKVKELENKILASEIREKQLISKVTELERKISIPIIFGYKVEDSGINYIKFDINSKVIDFRPYNLTIGNEHQREFKLNNMHAINEFNKFNSLEEIIFDLGLSPIYCNDQFTLKYKKDGDYHRDIRKYMIFNNPMLYLPSVTILKIYIQDNTDVLKQFGHINNIGCIGNLISLPNLKKIYLINNTIYKNFPNCLSEYVQHSGYKKYLKHILIKNDDIITDENFKRYMRENNIQLEYI
jgi:hypothetical protein